MGKLGDALRRKYRTPKDALVALGLDPALLDVKRLATDSKRRGRDGALFDDQVPEMRAARELSGETFEKRQRELDRELTDSMTDDNDRDEFDEDRDEQQRAKRRECMKKIGEIARDEWGMSEDEIRHELMNFPRNGLSHMNAAAFDEDFESVWEEHLAGMGGGATTGPGYSDAPKAGDRRRQRAHDRRMALDAKRERNFLRRFPEAERLTPRGNDFCNYGDQPTLAYDSAADDGDSEFYKMFPEARRLSTPG